VHVVAAVIPMTREDTHNGEYLEREFGANVKFDHPRGRWYIWHKGQHYWREDDHEEILLLTNNAAKRRALAAVNMGSMDALKVAMGLYSVAKKKAALEHLRFLPGIAVGQMHWDQNLDLFACANGVIELRTGTLRPGKQSDLITKASQVRFDAQATCPRWMQFLKEVFVTDEMIEYVRTIVGYCMTGMTTEQVWFLLYGTGGNGKSVFVAILEAIFGVKNYYESAAAETFISSRWGSSGSHNVAQLRGARLVVASEVPERSSFDGSRIKSLTGSDPVTAAAKYENNVTFVPQLKLMMLVNHLPSTHDDSLGFWRRLRTIPFEVSFVSNPDATLVDTLRAELPGILNWMVGGAMEWFASGLAPEPSNARTLKDEYQAESDPLSMFIHECVVETRNAADTISAREVYRIYTDWCIQQKVAAMNETNFGRSGGISALGLGKKRHSSGYVHAGIQVYPSGVHPVAPIRVRNQSAD
jgi:putative DNA primase/helicase